MNIILLIFIMLATLFISGSGLGLYICRNLMHLMNGEIFAQINDNAEMCVNLYLKMM